MPLESIGSYAVVGSTGANARGARQSVAPQYSVANDSVFAATSARGGDTGGEEVRLPSSTPNLAVYLSPFIRLDLETRLAIVEFRDSQTGAVKQQYPSPRVVEQYRQNLPESSDLQPAPSQAKPAESPDLQVQIIGPSDNAGTSGQPAGTTGTGTTGPVFGTGQSGAPAPTPAPQAQAAAAAFSAAQSAPAPAPSRELAIA